MGKTEDLEEKITNLRLAVGVLETKFEHTIANKHAEAIATAKAIDTKFKWISVIIGGIATVGTIISIYVPLAPKP